MLNLILQYRLDAAAFALMSFSLIACAHLWLRCSHKNRAGIPLAAWGILLVLLLSGAAAAEKAGLEEKTRLKNMIHGFAPTYAQELERMGHAKIRLDTPPNDPLYLSMIEAQVRWEKVNRSISDIYTFRRLPDGKNVLVVDSETDYNQNGIYDGDREQRTPLGEIYPHRDPAMEAALAGRASFDEAPYTDRWGTWVSAYMPMRDEAGKVEAVLGVDYDARDWLIGILQSRGALLGFMMILVVVLCACTLIFMLIDERERQFESLVSNIPGAVYRCAFDRDWTMHFVSPAIHHITGYFPEDFTGKKSRSYGSVIHPEDREKTDQALRIAVAERQAYTMEYRIFDASGRVRWVYQKGRAVYSPDGNVLWLDGAIFDITQQKMTLEALRKSEECFLMLSRATNDAVWDWDVVTNNLWWGEGFTVLFGYRMDEIEPDLKSWTNRIHPEDQERTVAGVFEVIKKGGRFWSAEYRFRRKDGSYATIFDRGYLIYDSKGNAVRMVGAIVDITQRKQAEEALRQSERLYAALFTGAPDAILTMDNAGNLQAVNPAAEKILGYRREELLGKHIAIKNLLADNSRAKTLEEFALVLMGKERPPFEVEFLHKSGRTLTFEAHSRLMKTGDQPSGIQIIFRDLTQRKHLEEQLRQSQKMEAVGKLAGGVAHDFNNLLTVINGYSDVALGMLSGGDAIRPLLEEIQKAGERAAGLTNQLLSFSRKQIVQPKVVNLNEVIINMDRMLRRLIMEKIELVMHALPELWLIRVDRVLLEQVLMNLVVNARDAMPQGGRITIETKNVFVEAQAAAERPELGPGEYVLLRVNDNGSGMPPDVLARVFEPFFTTKPMGKGTGLGLATSYGIVKQAGGHIFAESEPGRGTTFDVYLPRWKDDGRAQARKEETSAVMPRGHETVLLVEDEPSVRMLASRVLTEQGYRVLEAGDGKQALDVIASRAEVRLDLLLTDMVMPQMDGKELAEKIVKIYPKVKLLFTSGYTDDAVVRQTVMNQAVEFITKPFTPKNLAIKVREVLDAKGNGSA